MQDIVRQGLIRCHAGRNTYRLLRGETPFNRDVTQDGSYRVQTYAEMAPSIPWSWVDELT